MTVRALAMCLVAALSVLGPWQASAEVTRPKPRPLLVTALVQPEPAARPAHRPELAAGIARPETAGLRLSVPVAPPAQDPNRGAVTNMPLPRFVSLKTGEGNARRGPGLTHRIDWVFTRAGMPLKITAEHEHWRRVEDAEGLGGWVHFALLSGVRNVLVAAARADFHTRPDLAAPIAFQAEAGVVGKVMECGQGWCRVNIDGDKGWAQTQTLWGVATDEVIE